MEEKKTLKQLIEEKSEQAKMKVHTAVEWCKNNQETVTILGPAIIEGFVQVVKIISKNRSINEERALKDRYIYDRSARHYYELRRKPKNSEWLQIDHRKRNGEPLGHILNNMKLLK